MQRAVPARKAAASCRTPKRVAVLLSRLATLEQGQGDGVGLGDVAGVVYVQVVAAVVSGQDLCGTVRVADGFVKIDYAIEFAAGADPSVDVLADLLVLGTVEMVIERVAKKGVLERRNRCADDAD